MKKLAVVPLPSEEVVSIWDHREHFKRLTSINVSLTNKCNLQCRYCYEQHRKEYGKYELEDVWKTHDFLMSINDLPDKNIIFFGGEPLLKKDLILEFLRSPKVQCNVAIVSNCLLLTPEFIDEYFSFPNTRLIMSIDTFNSDVDQRQIPQEKLDALKDKIRHIPASIKEAGRVTVRPTVSHQTAPGLTQFMTELYHLGIRSFIVQPLIMGNLDGFINWTTEQWHKLTKDTIEFFRTHDDIHIEVTEGVGKRSTGNNCLSGYDIISVDPSGDFSGCFFFVNQKDKAGSLISGNIFTGQLFINREKEFDRQYREMFTAYEECRTCDLNDHCYQCPAGNLDTTGTLYRPDSMCKRFVQFYFLINTELFRIRFKRHLTKIMAEYSQHGKMAYLETLSRVMMHFGFPKRGYSLTDEFDNVASHYLYEMRGEGGSFADLFHYIVEERGFYLGVVDERKIHDPVLFRLTFLLAALGD